MVAVLVRCYLNRAKRRIASSLWEPREEEWAIITSDAIGPYLLPPGHRRLELLPPHFLSGIWGSRVGGTDATDHLYHL
jgi:hypothetical protein